MGENGFDPGGRDFPMGNFSLASILRELRRQKSVSQSALADALDISVQAVSKWETGVSHS